MADAVSPSSGLPSLAPVAWTLAAILALVAVDLASDVAEGVTLEHVSMEGAIVLLAAAGLAWTVARILRERAALAVTVERLAGEATSWRLDASRWRAQAESLNRGFVEAVEAEFSRWGLTLAERDVALLLLKGVSTRDIGELRGTSERTVRQQAAAIYAKAGVGSRTELASYFLDALPSPSSSSTGASSSSA